MKTGTDVLRTERLILRPFTDEDAQNVYENFGSEEAVYKTLPWEPHKNIEETKRIVHQWVERYSEPERYYWCIDLKEGKAAIGSIYLVNTDEKNKSLEAGFCLGTAYWNKGIISEALTAVCEHMELLGNVDYIWGRHHIENPASGKVFLKSGFSFEGKKVVYGLSVKREIETMFYKRICQNNN